MSKYYTLIVILIGLLLQSCSDESKSTDCSQCAQNTQCETCQECQQCPTCKEGDECPAPSCPTCPTCKEGDECPTCPAPSCPTCPTCKEGDECPACNCKECDECKDCPECNTDALNSQLTACNNELTTTKQALETEQNANESCVGDLDTCNKDLSDLSAKPRSKSGSRLIFKEHKMSDGSVYVEPYPYDTKLSKYVFLGMINNMTCFLDIADANVVITNYNHMNLSLPEAGSNTYNGYYTDNHCTNALNPEVAGKLVYTTTCSQKLNSGDIFVSYKSRNCDGGLIYEAKKITVLKNIDDLYYNGDGGDCRLLKYGIQTVLLSDASDEDIRAYYVCEE